MIWVILSFLMLVLMIAILFSLRFAHGTLGVKIFVAIFTVINFMNLGDTFISHLDELNFEYDQKTTFRQIGQYLLKYEHPEDVAVILDDWYGMEDYLITCEGNIDVDFSKLIELIKYYHDNPNSRPVKGEVYSRASDE
ncbi:MAG: hypothetical protein IKZ46_03540 [Victivallales bacterium]|nr:hypothetical protein [Victivallales bacterium]